MCRTAAAARWCCFRQLDVLTRCLHARGLRGSKFRARAPARPRGGARVWRLTCDDTPSGGAVSRRTTSAADTRRRRGEEMAPEDARQADALHSFPRSASLCECSLPAPRTSPTSTPQLAVGPVQYHTRKTEAARIVRGWGIASMLRDVGHLVSLTEFEDKLANAISTKYASRDLSPTSKRNAGCASALCVCVCRARVRAAEVDFVLRACPLASASSFLHTVEKDYVQYVEAYKSDARGAGGEVSTG